MNSNEKIEKLQQLRQVVDNLHNRPKHIRAGQHLWNEAEKLFPEEVDRLRASNVDCFYVDDRMIDFIEVLIKLI